MLVILGGWERTEPEYTGLLGKAGSRLTRMIPASRVSIVGAVLAWDLPSGQRPVRLQLPIPTRPWRDAP